MDWSSARNHRSELFFKIKAGFMTLKLINQDKIVQISSGMLLFTFLLCCLVPGCFPGIHRCFLIVPGYVKQNEKSDIDYANVGKTDSWYLLPGETRIALESSQHEIYPEKEPFMKGECKDELSGIVWKALSFLNPKKFLGQKRRPSNTKIFRQTFAPESLPTTAPFFPKTTIKTSKPNVDVPLFETKAFEFEYKPNSMLQNKWPSKSGIYKIEKQYEFDGMLTRPLVKGPLKKKIFIFDRNGELLSDGETRKPIMGTQSTYMPYDDKLFEFDVNNLNSPKPPVTMNSLSAYKSLPIFYSTEPPPLPIGKISTKPFEGNDAIALEFCDNQMAQNGMDPSPRINPSKERQKLSSDEVMDAPKDSKMDAPKDSKIINMVKELFEGRKPSHKERSKGITPGENNRKMHPWNLEAIRWKFQHGIASSTPVH